MHLNIGKSLYFYKSVKELKEIYCKILLGMLSITLYFRIIKTSFLIRSQIAKLWCANFNLLPAKYCEFHINHMWHEWVGRGLAFQSALEFYGDKFVHLYLTQPGLGVGYDWHFYSSSTWLFSCLYPSQSESVIVVNNTNNLQHTPVKFAILGCR